MKQKHTKYTQINNLICQCIMGTWGQPCD